MNKLFLKENDFYYYRCYLIIDLSDINFIVNTNLEELTQGAMVCCVAYVTFSPNAIRNTFRERLLIAAKKMLPDNTNAASSQA